MGCPVLNRKGADSMKTAKWLMALAAIMMMVAGCEKSDEQKLKDAAEDAQKDAAKAAEGVKLPGSK